MTEYLTACYPCAQGLYAECLDPLETPDGLIVPCAVRYGSQERRGQDKRGGEVLAPHEVGDVLSTGRKRAAMLAVILDGSLCEWAGLKHAGGGVVPIVGCARNQIADSKSGNPDKGYLPGARHHGPDKTTLNNATGTNLHRICAVCHNRWHALNDPFYTTPRPEPHLPWNPNQEYYLHDPLVEATTEEQELTEEWWAKPVKDRPPYPIVPEHLRKIAP